MINIKPIIKKALDGIGYHILLIQEKDIMSHMEQLTVKLHIGKYKNIPHS